ncbi:MAG TPA: universal stress protein [Polyangiaceae bacterium]
MHEPARSYERILVPVDFSPASAASLAYALSFGSAFGARVDALHVWRTNTQTPMHVARERVKQSLAEFLAPLAAPGGSELHTRTDYGDPYLTILQLAQLSSYDLLVLIAPRPGRSRPNHLGASLLAAARVPVLLIPPAWLEVRREPDLRRHLRRVLLPAAFGGRSLRAVERALALARAFGAKLELWSVDDPSAAADQARALSHVEASGRAVAEGIERREGRGELAQALAARSQEGGYDLLLTVERAAGLAGGATESITSRLLGLQRCPLLCERVSGAVAR